MFYKERDDASCSAAYNNKKFVREYRVHPYRTHILMSGTAVSKTGGGG